MPRTILVTEGDSPLGSALVRLLAARGYSIAAACDGAPSNPGAARSPLLLPWNRRSPVSARTVLLSALNVFDTLDEALILEPPFLADAPLNAVPSADIERAFDEAKGPLFLCRELLGSFLAHGGGVIGFVSVGPAAGPVGSAAHEAFKGLAGSLLASPGSGTVVANGFQCGTVDTEEYAAFIDRTLEEKARKITGRWFSFAPRGGFLQGVRAAR
jgi:NAD(P)-dependent dehydrogenase (short-subunit alcohol dehydrogenase family)